MEMISSTAIRGTLSRDEARNHPATERTGRPAATLPRADREHDELLRPEDGVAQAMSV